MFDISRIDLEDFRSFNGKHNFSFPTEPGLYGISGENQVNPELGANGIGKSSLLDAIRWCYYGTTSRGLRAGDVINYDAKSCSVTVEHNIAGEDHTVTRTQSPNSLRLDGTTVDQTTLEKHLRLGPDAFDYAVMFPQFGHAFFGRSAADKLALFSQIMELDYWLGRSKAADELARELSAEKSKIEQDAAKLTGSLETLKDDLAELITKLDAFDAEKQSKLKQFKEKLKEANKGLEFYRSRHADIDKTMKGLEQRRQKKETEAETQRRLENEQRSIAVTLKRLSVLDAECPTCLQKVDARHLKAEKARLEKAEQLLLTDLEAVAGARSDLMAILKNISDFEGEKHTLGTKIARAEEAQDQIEQAINEEQERANPYTPIIDAKKAQRLKLKTALEESQEAIKQMEQDHAAVSYWVAGFKRVRLFIVEQALQQLELEINNSLSSLGLLEWRVELDVERENKSGGVTKSFTVMVYPPNATKPIRLEAYSGGETQRLRLAGNLGLANLIMERAGLRNTIEFFDEPTSHMSAEGISDLLNTLSDRAARENKQIWVIDHHSLDSGRFTGMVKIIKDNQGSKICPLE